LEIYICGILASLHIFTGNSRENKFNNKVL